MPVACLEKISVKPMVEFHASLSKILIDNKVVTVANEED
jgi:hypothetical protein